MVFKKCLYDAFLSRRVGTSLLIVIIYNTVFLTYIRIWDKREILEKGLRK